MFPQLILHFSGSACGEQAWALLGHGRELGHWDGINPMQPPAPLALLGSAHCVLIPETQAGQ